MEQLIPIPTLHLFPVLDKMLIELLRSLTPEQWDTQTVAPLWTVKDVAAHLLDTNVRNIAALHGYEPPVNAKINSYQDLIDFLNELNATWVSAMKRVSPRLITEMLEQTGKPYIEYLNQLEPFAQAKYSVAWAGEQTSQNWFHIAREYTEKWHHQQQIRDAVGAEGLFAKELFYPCIDTFMYALPHNYHSTDAALDTTVQIIISGEAGGSWFLYKDQNLWQLTKQQLTTPKTSIELTPDIAWKLFTKALKPREVKEKAIIKGDITLAEPLFNTLAVMA